MSRDAAAATRLAAITTQVARIERAAAFLANGLSLGQCPAAAAARRSAMPAKLIGNGLRELDLFLTDLIAAARRIARPDADGDPGVRPSARLSSAAEAWRRAEPHLGLAIEGRIRLRALRAAQNRQCFGRMRGPQAEAEMLRACADYARLARDVMRAAGVGA